MKDVVDSKSTKISPDAITIDFENEESALAAHNNVGTQFHQPHFPVGCITSKE